MLLQLVAQPAQHVRDQQREVALLELELHAVVVQTRAVEQVAHQPLHLLDRQQAVLDRLVLGRAELAQVALVERRQHQAQRADRPVEVVHGALRHVDELEHLALELQALLVERAEALGELEVGLHGAVQQRVVGRRRLLG